MLSLTVGLAVAAAKPHIVMVVADDLGYDDLGHGSVMGNNGTTITPNINALINGGLQLAEYYTFKVRVRAPQVGPGRRRAAAAAAARCSPAFRLLAVLAIFICGRSARRRARASLPDATHGERGSTT